MILQNKCQDEDKDYSVTLFVVAGLVHSVSSPLYSLGSTVSEGARQFVETGLTDKMEMETVNKTFLDAVLAPPILTGVGQTNTTIFVDSNHTKVEMARAAVRPDNKLALIEHLCSCCEVTGPPLCYLLY